jgi:hypothetical protein
MAELMLINPRKRRRKAKKTTSKRRGKRRTMTALQRKYFGKRKQRKVNPIMAKKSVKRRRRYNVMAKKSRRYRRNPTGGGRFNIQSFSRNTLMPSAIGAAGALGLDVLMGFLPLPPAMKMGPMRTVVKIVGAVGIGMLAGTFVKRSTAEQIAAGAITVALYDTLKGALKTAMPTLTLGDADDVYTQYPSLAYAGAGQVVGDMGEYVSDDGNVGLYVGDEQMPY